MDKTLLVILGAAALLLLFYVAVFRSVRRFNPPKEQVPAPPKEIEAWTHTDIRIKPVRERP